jgi:hydroxymethylpyrimidine/phosphomethylpyrimidine kinase
MENFAPGQGSKARSVTPTARILIIAGSDSGGGAGIQADIKTAAILGAHPMTAVTAVTAQNTLGVEAVHPIPAEMILAQIDAVVGEDHVDALVGQARHLGDAVALQDRVERKLALCRLRRAKARRLLRDASDQVHDATAPFDGQRR